MKLNSGLLFTAVISAATLHAQDRSSSSLPSLPVPGVFILATNGNDQWSGALPNPNAGKTDGPFATLQRAVKAARDFRSRQPADKALGATVWVRNGTYF